MVDELGKLPRMSPENSPDVSGYKPKAWVSIEAIMSVFGIWVILASGFLLLFVYGHATMTDSSQGEPAYWDEVRNKMFELEFGGKITLTAFVGFMVGGSVLVGALRLVRRRRAGSRGVL